MMVYGIDKPAKGASREAYVTMENWAKARFLMHESLSKACGKPVFSSFIDSGLVNSLFDNGRPKSVHELAKNSVAKTFLEHSEEPGATTATIRSLTDMIRNKDFSRMVKVLEKDKNWANHYYLEWACGL